MKTRGPGYEPPTPETLAITAFERALADSGLTRQDIDGVSVSFLYGGPTARETAELLGVNARYAVENGGVMAGPLPTVCAAIAAGKCDKMDKMHMMVRKGLAPQMRDARDQAFAMAGLALSDVQHFEGYDASTIHLIHQLEGFGFAERGAGLEFCKSGAMAIDGKLPVNTAGGMLSGSYMHGWNHVVEITRQLRHEAGLRQVNGVQASLFSLAQTDQVQPIVFTRGA